jgi:cytochrome c oxidase subunit 2
MQMDQPLQSILAPSGPVAGSIAGLAWLLFAGGGLITLAVVGLAGWAAFRRPQPGGWLARESSVLLLGLAIPLATVTALVAHALVLARETTLPGAPDALAIDVTGEQWWWRVSYPEAGIELANEIHLPVGREVELSLASRDVIHSFWVPQLAGKLDMIPGRANRLRLVAEKPGLYRGQCAEYCGGAHAFMAFHVVAHTPEAFAAWLERERGPASDPVEALPVRGRRIFLAAGCGACHRVRGTPAAGEIGPDLTHVGARVALGAGMFPNHTGTLAGWIASSQHLKPGNRMPSFRGFTGLELRALATYLSGLD